MHNFRNRIGNKNGSKSRETTQTHEGQKNVFKNTIRYFDIIST